jgi:hypothetical protein
MTVLAWLITVPFGDLHAADWDSLLAERLQESITYREAVLQRRSAAVRAGIYNSPLNPYVEIGTTTGAGARGIRLQDGDLDPLQFTSSIAVTHLFGTTVELSAPIILEGDQDPVGPVALQLTRRLFPEDGAERPAAMGTLLQAQQAEYEACLAVKLALAAEILDARYSLQLLRANRENLRVLERLGDAVVDPRDEREISRRVLQMRRGIMQAEHRLADLDGRIRDASTDLYQEVLERSEEWLENLSPEQILAAESPVIRAQEFQLAAAVHREKRWYLPYLPNPTIGAGVEYDMYADDYSWYLSLQFSVTLLDRGERALEALRRRENATIERLRLQQIRDRLQREVDTVKHELSILEIDRRLRVLDVEDEEENVAQVRALYEAGFETEENVILAEVDLSVERLAATRVEHDYILRRLELLRYAGARP